MKKYSFQMTEEEVRELCIRALWERLRLQRSKCLLILAVLILEYIFVSWTVALAMAVFLLLLFGAGIVRSVSAMKKQLCGKTRTIEVEGEILKPGTEGEMYSEVPCSSITEVRTTHHLLMLGSRQASKVIGWYPVPLRVFADKQERDLFLESVRNPQVRPCEKTTASDTEGHGETSAVDPGVQAAEKSEQEYFSLSFQVGEEEWVRMTATAAEIIQAGTLGEQKNRSVRIVLLAVFSALLCAVSWFSASTAGVIRMVSFMGAIVLLVLLRNLLENPERKIRNRLRRGMMQNNVLGLWETSVTEAGIRQSTSGSDSVMIPWENWLCVVETDHELFFIQKDKKHYRAIPKKGLESREQIEELKNLCREKHLEILEGKRKKYVPNWLFPLLIVVVAAGSILLENKDSLKNAYPKYVPFEEQVSVLRSLGFTISEETEESMCAYIKENVMNLYVGTYPYMWLLSNLTWNDAGERTDWDPNSVNIFWFDFEGRDIYTDYIRVLEGMQKLSAGSILDDVENIQEDTENINWEKGTGTITVSLEWNGQEHSWNMDVQSDWIDADVLGIYNGLLEREGVSERFYMTGDDGQGAFVFYCTKEWASAFEKATGLDLELYMVKKGW